MSCGIVATENSVLAGIEARGTDGAWRAAAALWARARDLAESTAGWSIAELRLSEEDVGWLRGWAGDLGCRALSTDFRAGVGDRLR